MPDTPVNLPFPFSGLQEYTAYQEQPDGTSADLQNVVAVDPSTGRRRGGQRPGIAKFVTPAISSGASAASIQEIIHTVGPNFSNAHGAGQLIFRNPSSANWGALNNAGTKYTSGGTDSHLYQMSCWDVNGNFYVATRPTATSTALDIQKYSAADGSSVWADTANALNITHGNSSSGAFVVAGMCALGPYLYVLYDGAGDYNDVIFRYYLATGNDVDGGSSWAQKGDEITGGIFTTHRAHYMAKSGDYIGVVTLTGVAGTSELKLYLDVLNPETGAQLSSTAVATVTGSDADSDDTLDCYGIVGDGAGNFFVSYQYKDDSAGNYTTNVEYRTAAGANVGAWPLTSTTSDADKYVNALAYDSVNHRIGCVGPNVMNTGKSFVIYAAADKATDASKLQLDYNSETSWDRVYADEDGAFLLAKNSTGNNIVKVPAELSLLGALDPTPEWTYNAAENDQDYPLSINTTYAVSIDEQRPRQSRLLVVAGGTVKAINRKDNTVSSVTAGDNALDQAAPVIYGASYFPDIYFADGKSTKYYRSLNKQITTWTASAGSLPSYTVNTGNGGEVQRPRLICTWNARIVQSGLAGDPQNWFMSAMTDPTDWDYSPSTTCETMAVAGNASDASEVQDVINALIPWNNDYLVFGMDHSIGQMSGNPAGGGRFDMLSDVTGVAWGRAFALHPDKSLWFIGSRGGLYRFELGQQQPARISETTIDERLADLDLAETIIRMQWDDRMQGFLIALTPTDRTTSTTHYFFDTRNQSWFPWQFANVDHNPKVIYLFDGDESADRVMLLGSWDGYVRNLDYDGTADDGTAIDSYVMIGPLQSPELVSVMLTSISAVLGTSSSDVTWTLHPGDSAQEAITAPSVSGGTFGSGKNRWSRYRVAGHSLFIKLRNNSNNQSWQMEGLQVTIRATSAKFARTH